MVFLDIERSAGGDITSQHGLQVGRAICVMKVLFERTHETSWDPAARSLYGFEQTVLGLLGFVVAEVPNVVRASTHGELHIALELLLDTCKSLSE